MWHAVIMAGGSGTRFWPASRRQLPKQFLRVVGEHTLIQEAAYRCRPTLTAERTWVVTGATHQSETRRQLPDVPVAQILTEPCGRNTAPCIAMAAMAIAADDPHAIMLVMPADHVISPNATFLAAVEQAVRIVEHDPHTLALFGVPPNSPATGFGYIERSTPLASDAGAYRVQAFKEKPNAATAAEYIATGRYYWNCGIFVWRAQTILDQLREHEPVLFGHLETLRKAWRTPQWDAVLSNVFPQMPSISIDYAVLERAKHVAVVPAPYQWDDVGSWEALPRLLGETNGHTLDGRACVVESKNCIVRSTGQHVVAVTGVENLIIVHTPEATLVARRDDEAGLRNLVKELEARGFGDVL